MSSKSLQFISPGVFLREFDQSGSPALLDADGPLVIGRSQKGPAMRPVVISSFDEFVQVFGTPTPTNYYSDVWRDNKILGPTYGVIAAEAALRGRKNVTFVRLLGCEHVEAETTGVAGWKVGEVSDAALPTGGAYGLYLFESDPTPLNEGDALNVAGTLAAVWYLLTGSVSMVGTLANGDTFLDVEETIPAEGNAALFKLFGKEAKVVIRDEGGAILEESAFNFDSTSDRFIRKVFNTNPTRLNSDLYAVTERKTYFLGETFEDFINNAPETVGLRTSNTSLYGMILALKGGVGLEHNNRSMPFRNSSTGWFFRQDLMSTTGSYDPDEMDKLFKLHSLDSGEYNQNNIKISIVNIKSSNTEGNPYGTFGVLVRQMGDSDSSIDVVEQFFGCDLNPDSERYVAKVIGDKYVKFNSTTRYNEEFGSFNNNSRYIRVEVSDLVSNGAVSPESLPFGVFGPVKYADFAIVENVVGNSKFVSFTDTAMVGSIVPFCKGGTQISETLAVGPNVIRASGLVVDVTASVVMPTFRTKKNTLSSRNTFFGVDVSTSNGRFSDSVKDLTRVLAFGVDNETPDAGDLTQYSWIFTLDNVRKHFNTVTSVYSNTDAEYSETGRVDGLSFTATGSANYKKVLDAGHDKFTTVLTGGFDGFDITEIEPFRNEGLINQSEKTSYAFNSISRAIDVVRDPEEVDFNVLTMPGLTNYSLNKKMIDLCGSRGDAICLFDLAGGHQPRSENSTSQEDRVGSVDATVSEARSYGLNTSYAATYYPWVQVRESISGNLLYVPPSVVALGTWSMTDNNFAEWYAPSGFSRGGLSDGASGLTVTNILHQVRKLDRDKLYEDNINPIAKITKQGIVIWGQKTTLKTPTNSALNRINVRRGMIAIKKTISRIAATTLFEQNNRQTWNSFKSRARVYLDDVVSRYGIEEYKLILDETTTTPDLIDRNIIYAKLFVKPTKVVEGIFIDFTITNQGANFELL